MSEKFTPTPSSHLNNMSLRRDVEQGLETEERKYNVLEAREAAYAAMPFMDTAKDLYDTYKSLENYDHLEDVVKETNLQSLVAYAEKRAHNTAEAKNVPELTHAEKSVIEAFQAEKELLKSQQAIFDSSDELMLSSDGLKGAIDVAYDRRKATKDHKEAFKWQKMEDKLKRYSDYLDDTAVGSNNLPDRELFAEFNPDTSRASRLLDSAVYRNGELKDVDSNYTVPGVRDDANRMRQLAEMNNFLAELYPKPEEADAGYETPTESHEPHYNLVETVPEAKDLIYSNPDYLTKLIDESEAYAKFSADKLDTSNAVISSNLKTMERDLPEVRQVVQDWRETSGMSFKQYIEAVSEGDIEATQDQQNAAIAAKMMLKNRFWRESSMARRMSRQVTNKSEVGDIDTAFSAGYFSS